MKKARLHKNNKPVTPRIHKVTFMLNDEEQRAVARYLERYKISNKSRWYRETVLSHILKVMEEDYPTLFNENEMRR
ncbi:hypothetical protein [Parabacteroides sp. PF5-6]|uniref:hypothetical protein n=1 Tax=Parabacteroides sp. PF5-6 TaxID=1742403 RepID=UPI0024065B36|nr:hypothetical protein [Parabacteroides sp. PF5-6]MDF9829975.1 hypothetical protein [Parabacteroides sp. PF5-6]